MKSVEQTMNRRDVLKAGTIASALALGGFLSPLQAAGTSFKLPTRDKPLLLNSNESAYGFSSLVKKALDKKAADLSLYPFKAEEELRSSIARFYQVKEDNICVSNGSSAALQAAIYAVSNLANELNMPFRIINPNPTFEFPAVYAKPLGIEVVNFDLDSKFNMNVDAMKKSEREFDGISLVYLCNPNNPTGNIVSANDLYSWVRNAKQSTIFLIDEAYAEYVIDPAFKSGIDILKDGAKNVIVTRTFSKIYGLAGLRVGYAVTTPELQRRIKDFLQLAGINVCGAVASTAALADFNFRQYCVNSNVKSRQIVTKTLDSLGLRYAPSHANFIFHEITGSYDDFAKNMRNQNILVGRQFVKFDNFCRVTLGTPQQAEYYVKVLKTFRQKRYI